MPKMRSGPARAAYVVSQTSRISLKALAQAITKVRVMDMRQKEQLADEVFRVQPRMFASALVQKRIGVSLKKMEFLFARALGSRNTLDAHVCVGVEIASRIGGRLLRGHTGAQHQDMMRGFTLYRGQFSMNIFRDEIKL